MKWHATINMAKYKNRGNIDFLKMHRFDLRIKENEFNISYDLIKDFMETFYKGYPIELALHCQNEWKQALETSGKVQNLKFNLDLQKAEQFIDLDTLANLDKELFLKLAVKRKYPWQSKIINVETANYVFSLFTIELPK